jgi:hypothetical protein
MAKEPQSDVVTVGVSKEADQMMKDLIGLPWFGFEIDVYRFAVAVALARDLPPVEVDSRITKFNQGTLETPTNQVSVLIRALGTPGLTDRPYAYSQALAESGIRYLHRLLIAEATPFQDVLSAP